MVRPESHEQFFSDKVFLKPLEKTGIPAKQIWHCSELPLISFKTVSLGRMGRMGRMGQVFLPSAYGK